MRRIIHVGVGAALIVGLSIVTPLSSSAIGSNTVVVTNSDLVTGSPSPGQFVKINQSGAQGSVALVTGPGAPPLGSGSLQLKVTGPADHWSVYNYDHIGTDLSQITGLTYATYTDNTVADPALQIEINPGNTVGTDAGVTYSTLNFEPYLQSGGVTPNTWQTWDVRSGMVWGTHLSGAPNSAPLTWNTFLTTYPNATIKGGVGVNVGSNWSAMTGESDALTIGTATQTTIYDFEPNILRISTHSLPNASVNTTYRATLTASGGNPPYKWTILSGRLPSGLHLSRTRGVISGKPRQGDSGTSTFTVKVVDKKIRKTHPPTQNTDTKVLSITFS